jgi:hypothetical protein
MLAWPAARFPSPGALGSSEHSPLNPITTRCVSLDRFPSELCGTNYSKKEYS